VNRRKRGHFRSNITRIIDAPALVFDCREGSMVNSICHSDSLNIAMVELCIGEDKLCFLSRLLLSVSLTDASGNSKKGIEGILLFGSIE
jgi:hypothetical protein